MNIRMAMISGAALTLAATAAKAADLTPAQNAAQSACVLQAMGNPLGFKAKTVRYDNGDLATTISGLHPAAIIEVRPGRLQSVAGVYSDGERTYSLDEAASWPRSYFIPGYPRGDFLKWDAVLAGAIAAVKCAKANKLG